MRKSVFALLGSLALALTASAQTKVSAKLHCGKSDQSLQADVGDKPGHVLMLSKSSCSYTSPLEIEGLKSKDGNDTSTSEISGSMGRDGGYHVATMDNGDKFVVHYSGSSKMNNDNTGSFEGKWTFVSGTGKLKGIKGGGTYKGALAADGSNDVEIEGEYTISAGKTPAKK